MSQETTTHSYRETRHDVPRLRYQLTNGAIIPAYEVNNHHALFENGWYQTDKERLLKTMGGLVLPMYRNAHNYGKITLHGTVEPPTKPSERLQDLLLDFGHDVYTDPYEGFEEITHFIGDVANTSHSSELAQEAFDLHDNFSRQQDFIDAGRVIPIGRL